MWDAATGEASGFSAGIGWFWNVSGASFTQEDQTLLFVLGNRMELWNWRERLRLETFASGDVADPFDDRIHAMALGADERLLALAREDSRLQLWILPNMLPVALTIAESEKPRHLAFNPDSTTLAVASEDHVQFWSIQVQN